MNIIYLLAVNVENILKALEIMWKGIVAIFIVIVLIIIVTKLVNKICVSVAEKREKSNKEENIQSASNQQN